MAYLTIGIGVVLVVLPLIAVAVVFVHFIREEGWNLALKVLGCFALMVGAIAGGVVLIVTGMGMGA